MIRVFVCGLLVVAMTSVIQPISAAPRTTQRKATHAPTSGDLHSTASEIYRIRGLSAEIFRWR